MIPLMSESIRLKEKRAPKFPTSASHMMKKYSMIGIAAILILLSFINKGLAGNCTLDNINIGTERSGREIEGKPEWNVQVINNCDCPQKQIVLSCSGFQTAEQVDPSILSKQGDTCLLISGGILLPRASVSFSYAWDPPFILLPRSSVAQCAP